jgi:hypothetical protein
MLSPLEPRELKKMRQTPSFSIQFLAIVDIRLYARGIDKKLLFRDLLPTWLRIAIQRRNGKEIQSLPASGGFPWSSQGMGVSLRNLWIAPPVTVAVGSVCANALQEILVAKAESRKGFTPCSRP